MIGRVYIIIIVVIIIIIICLGWFPITFLGSFQVLDSSLWGSYSASPDTCYFLTTIKITTDKLRSDTDKSKDHDYSLNTIENWRT